jgi:hypothetical protein
MAAHSGFPLSGIVATTAFDAGSMRLRSPPRKLGNQTEPKPTAGVSSSPPSVIFPTVFDEGSIRETVPFAMSPTQSEPAP